MNAIRRAMTRSTGPNTEGARKTDSEILWSALQADRQSRDERTARLRLMLLAIGTDRTA